MAESAQSRLGRGERDLHSKQSEKSCVCGDWEKKWLDLVMMFYTSCANYSYLQRRPQS